MQPALCGAGVLRQPKPRAGRRTPSGPPAAGPHALEVSQAPGTALSSLDATRTAPQTLSRKLSALRKLGWAVSAQTRALAAVASTNANQNKCVESTVVYFAIVASRDLVLECRESCRRAQRAKPSKPSARACTDLIRSDPLG